MNRDSNKKPSSAGESRARSSTSARSSSQRKSKSKPDSSARSRSAARAAPSKRRSGGSAASKSRAKSSGRSRPRSRSAAAGASKKKSGSTRKRSDDSGRSVGAPKVKRPMNAFAAYVKEQTTNTHIKKEAFQQMMSKLSDNWKKMSQAEKDNYKKKALKHNKGQGRLTKAELKLKKKN